jgi:DNA-binding HxlR family transcriptional regulator
MRDLSVAKLARFSDLGFDLGNCPVRSVLSHVSAKWTVLVLLLLQSGPKRFNALARGMPDVSKRMLTQSLRDLERDGLVARQVFDTKPPSVEYRLTPLGESLMQPIEQLVDWATLKQSEIADARARFDAA